MKRDGISGRVENRSNTFWETSLLALCLTTTLSIVTTSPPFCSYPNIPRNCPILRTFKPLSQSTVPYALGRSNKRAKSLQGTSFPLVTGNNVNVTFRVETSHAKSEKLYLWPTQLYLLASLLIIWGLSYRPNFSAMLALIWIPLIPIPSRHLHLLSLAEKFEKEREPLLMAPSSQHSIPRDRGVVADANQEVLFGNGVGEAGGAAGWSVWGFSFLILDGSDVSIPFMLLVHVRACLWKINISENGMIFTFYFCSFHEQEAMKKSLGIL